MEKVIEKRLRGITENQLEEEQYAFRKNRSTTDLIFTLRRMIEKHIEKDKTILMAFLDIEKAYDSVPRDKIWECLRQRNVPESLIRKVKMLYEDCQSCVQVGTTASSWFQTKRGVQQGSALSPYLFVLVMDEIMKEIKKDVATEVNALAFADDVVIWGYTVEELQERLNRWNDKFNEFKLTVSKEKTVVMAVNYKSGSLILKLGNNTLNNVNQFVYLGSTITQNGKDSLEVSNRINKAATLYHQVSNLMWDSNIPQKAKTTIYNSYFLPILTYSLETCTLNRKDNSRIQATEMKFLRTCMQKTRRDRIRNSDIRAGFGCEKTIKERV